MSTRTPPRVPIALPVVRISIEETGTIGVTVDKEPYATPAGFERRHVRPLVQELADQLGPIRVELREAAGETYVDIETPRDRSAPEVGEERSGAFSPGEHVIVAVIVGRHTADENGEVRVNLPPILRQRYGTALVLFGDSSRVMVPAADLDLRRGGAC